MSGKMSRRLGKRGLLVLTLAGVICFGLRVAKEKRGKPMPSHLEGYQYSATMRFAVLSVTNLSSRSVECLYQAELEFEDGWQSKWGKVIPFLDTPTVGGRKSGRWKFVVPPHDAGWRIVCPVLEHSPVEDLVVLRLSQYRLLSWTEKLVQPRTNVFTTDWINE